ncbi:Anaphase-promoting complex subunit 1 [Gracilariopsis chorda]|uniref:Anaphase-promoting complex subunit 1 n=1 Tax=Gracilariopsis chorda TaxID=448386 RepID=A0A2V3ICJ9_9FLOR|nr:Anaphase-promoting complex subunit 1 [Gracilariopsis chorda]|eukprot:PXF39822.1 Anaphase-promoting complex subunit 1 [Gracilariopsis chorda]
MATMRALPAEIQSDSTVQHVCDPAIWPSWNFSSQHSLITRPSFSGHISKWVVDGLVLRAASLPSGEIPIATALAHFQPLDGKVTTDFPDSSLPINLAWKPLVSASFCIASSQYITISTPSGDVYECPVPDARYSATSITRLFVPSSGLIVEVSRKLKSTPQYYYLSHPLHEMTPLLLPTSHRVICVSIDLPIIVSRTTNDLCIWTYSQTEDEPDTQVSTPRAVDPIAALIASAAPPEDPPYLLDVQPRRKILVPSQIFASSLSEDKQASVFLAHDLHGLLVLCIVTAGALTGLSLKLNPKDLSVMRADPAFRVRDVASAVPVLSIRRPHSCLDVLIRHSNGSISLFIGRNRLCTVELEPPSPVSNLTLIDGVGNEFSLSDCNGRRVRYKLHDYCFRSPLVNACISALSFLFESTDSLTRVMAVYHDMLIARIQQADPCPSGADAEWDLFQSVILRRASGSSCDASDPDRMEDHNDDIIEYSDDHWNSLQKSTFHTLKGRRRTYGPLTSFFGNHDQTRAFMNPADFDTFATILRALHLLYENYKFDKLGHNMLYRLAYLNVILARAIGATSFVDHYVRDFPELVDLANPVEAQSQKEQLRALSLLAALEKAVYHDFQKANEYAHLLSMRTVSEVQHPALVASWRAKSPFELSRRLISYYECLHSSRRGLDQASKSEATVLAMVRDNFLRADLDSLPFGVALPLQDALWVCRQGPKLSWPLEAFALIGREDIFGGTSPNQGSDETRGDHIPTNEDLALLQIRAKGTLLSLSVDNNSTRGRYLSRNKNADSLNSIDLKGKKDGCEMSGDIHKLRFGEDRRLEEVKRILRSTDFTIMTPIHVPTGVTPQDFDILAEQRFKLEALLRKRLAAPVGRGAFTLRTFVPSDPTQSLPVPPICLSGKLFAQNGAKVTVSQTDSKNLQWSNFHNGVAAGLRIVAAEEDSDCGAGHILTRSWIVNHKPSEGAGDATHAGMLLALGLGGYLPVLRNTDYYQYLVPRHELTSIGLMLGLAAGHVGSTHEKLTKMMCLHIKHFNGPGFAVPDFNVTMNVQTAAILGLGLLHRGSPDQTIIEGLFAELARSPNPGDPVDDREGVSLAAGISIGMLCLGSGSSSFAAADTKYIDRLLLYANGGPTDQMGVQKMKNDAESTRSGAVSGHGQARPGSSIAESETSRVREGSFVNSDVVSPGALIALSLIHMKTNNKSMASRIVLPSTLYSLDRARPQHVFLRIMTRSLIMWDEIIAREEWLFNTIPHLLHGRSTTGKLEIFDILGKVNITDVYRENEVDIQGVLQARAFAVAGACTVLALKYAGTNDTAAVGLLKKACLSFESALQQRGSRSDPLEWVLMTCLCSLSLAISIVGAGSGDLAIFRLLRRLRKARASSGSERYGFHLAMHMAVGFLFLGGGCLTFGTSATAIAGLLCAIYPHFPNSTNDNRYHLQAMRHLYVLAVEPRCIEPRDIDTGRPCCVDVEIRLRDGSKLALKAPCIVPEAKKISAIATVSERYLPSVFTINPPLRDRGWYSNTRNQIVFVKRQTGHLPYTDDPRGVKES